MKQFHQPPSIYVSGLTLKVSDLARSITFYEQVLGLTVLERKQAQGEKVSEQQADSELPAQAELGVASGQVLLTLVQPEHVTPLQPRTTGLYHFAILLPTRTDLARIVRHLTNLGVYYGSSDHLVSEALYLSDPDGNGIEIYRDRPSEDWRWQSGQVAMTVDPLDFTDLLSAAPTDSEPWAGMPEGTIVGHIHLHVSDIAQTERFYCEGLGFEVVTRYGGQASFLSTGAYHHHIGVNTWQGVGAPPPQASSAGLDHYTVVFPDEQARQQALTALKRLGAPVVERVDGYRTADPAGNAIELAVYG